MFDLGSVIAHIKADVTDFKKNINGASKTMSNFGKDMRNQGALLTATVTTPILALGTGFVKLASDAEETNSKFDAVFKDMAGSADEAFGTLAKTIGRSKTELKGYGATLQDTFVPLGFARDTASEMSIEVVKLSEDLASFNNLRTEDVVRDMQSALVGNTETLRKYGVVASQEAIVQEALTSGLIKNKNELNATTKAQAIFNLVMQGTADAQGDAERTAASTANQMKALQSEFKAMGEELGTLLIPIVQELLTHLRSLIEWFRGLSEEQQKTILVILAIVAAIGPLLIVLGSLAGAITAIITILPVIAALIAALLSPIGLVVIAIVALAAAWSTNAFGIQDKTKALWAFITEKFNSGYNFLVGVMGNIKKAIMGPFNEAKAAAESAINSIREKMNDLNPLQRHSPSVVDLVTKGVNALQDQYARLGDIGMPSASGLIANGDTIASSGSGMGGITINLAGANISSPQVANQYAEMIGDQIMRRLKMNVRF